MGTAATESDAYDARYAHCVAAVGGPEVFAKVRRCKVLVVGAGGIGCELLKNLVLVGFESLGLQLEDRVRALGDDHELTLLPPLVDADLAQETGRALGRVVVRGEGEVHSRYH